jgi:hypothetical protein
MDKMLKATWRTFIFSLAALAALWDLTKCGKLGAPEFLVALGGLLTLYGAKQFIEYKKKLNGGT